MTREDVDDISVLEDFITPPSVGGRFGARVDRSLMFRAKGGIFQVRIRDDGPIQSSYALLVRWSREREDWVTLSIRKPSEWGLCAVGGANGSGSAKHDREFYKPAEDDLIALALDFEDSLQDIGRAKPALAR
jgi:hypothetical protein